MSLVELKNVHKRYTLGETEVSALRGISMSIENGEYLAIAGPSGAGKSTILNLMGCIDNPTEGDVLIDDEHVDSLSEKQLTRFRRNKLGFIFQSFNLIPVLSVYENIELPLLLQKKHSAEERKDRVMHLIEEVELSDRIRNKPNELSGGQRQRVAIARALVTRPLIVLADEPTGNLDSDTGMRILELMQRINERDGTTFIFSTHDQKILELARRIIHIRDGRIEGEDRKNGKKPGIRDNADVRDGRGTS